MKKLLVIALIIASKLTGMYETIKTEDALSKEAFEQAIHTATKPEEIENLIKKYHTTHWDTFKLCAEKNSSQAVAYLLSRIMPAKPLVPDQLYDFFQKKERHENALVWGIFPTMDYIFVKFPGLLGECIVSSCVLCFLPTECVSYMTGPRKTPEEQALWDEYRNKLSYYKNVKLACKDVKDHAYRKGNMRFVQEFERCLARRKLATVEEAFKN